MAEPEAIIPAQPATFLQDNAGNQSAMRLIAVLCVGAAILFGAVVVLGKAGPDGFATVVAFLGAGIGGKVGQAALGK